MYWRHLSYQYGSSCLVMVVLFHHLDLLAIIDGRFGFQNFAVGPEFGKSPLHRIGMELVK